MKTKDIRIGYGTNVLIMVLFATAVFAQDIKDISPQPRSVVVKGNNLILTGEWRIAVDMSSREQMMVARYLKSCLQERSALNLLIEEYDPERPEKKVFLGLLHDSRIVSLMDQYSVNPQRVSGKEGYFLGVGKNSITVLGNEANGVFYGIISLMQLVGTKNDKVSVQEATIYDFPRLKTRGVYFLDIDFKNIKKQLNYMAEHKLNTAVIFDWSLFALEEPENLKKMKEVFDYARERFIEPIPELGCFGSAGPVLSRAPKAAEGIRVEEQHCKFVDNIAVPVKADKKFLVNVISGDGCDVLVTSPDRKQVYRNGTDYLFKEGELAYPYELTSRPSRIIRIGEGGIHEKEEVLVSYDYVENKCASWAPWSIPYCPFSAETSRLMSAAIESVINELGADAVFLGDSEIRGMNRDSRCKKNSLSNAEILAYNINKNYNLIKKIKPQCRVFIWDDMLNPWHNGNNENYQKDFSGPAGKTGTAIDLLPKDIRIVSWWYDEKDWLKKMEHSPAYFTAKGFEFLGAAWKNKYNIERWIDIAKQNDNCSGIIVTSWDGWYNNLAGINYAARLSWSN